MDKIIGPFAEVVCLAGLPFGGIITIDSLRVVQNGAVVVRDGKVLDCLDFDRAVFGYKGFGVVDGGGGVVIPAFVDCHTHICFAGTRVMDYEMRCSGTSYLDIAKAGGGIWSTVTQTRNATLENLMDLTLGRVERLLKSGVTTIEIKSGYGLSVDDELKMLRAIKNVMRKTSADIVPTCLATHIKPKDFGGTAKDYIVEIATKLLPKIQEESLAKRLDIFVEDTAFTVEDARFYASLAKGFDFTVHANQFTSGGVGFAVEIGAKSADHLEVISQAEIEMIAKSQTVAVALPGASFGLGMLNLTPARKLLDAGACLAIASDWNPGSAPMGDLLVQAAIFGACEKLTLAETLAGVTFRAAKALNLFDRGRLASGEIADFQVYDTKDFRDIFYSQGALKPCGVYKNGNLIV
jgi:imidazolonepropionase